jgi:hypothetical protein
MMKNNMTIHNENNGERLSFYKLFAKRNYKIVVPIIQREYAQGRKTEAVKEVRTDFLDALYGYLEDGLPYRDLDFVYGKLQDVEGQEIFVPLDGQQRLTTLFLLHWYLWNISDDEQLKAEFISKISRGSKSLFTYETRPSSTSFCDALVSHNIDMDSLVKDDDGIPSLSKTICNNNWYYLTWNYDPTIQSMLVMLDAIDKKFHGKKDFFPLLLSLDKPVITFLFMDLKKFKLTDELYIKMNSRGLPLTSFENFKAKYEQYLKGVKTNRTFNLDLGGKKTNVILKKYFSFNIDTKWTNLFWNYRAVVSSDDGKGKDDIDEELVNFIRVIFTFQYASSADISSKSKNDNLNSLLGGDEKFLSFNRYRDLDALSAEASLLLVDTFDVLSNGNDKIKNHLNASFKAYFDEEKTFMDALQNKFDNYAERINFYAYLQYLIKYGADANLNQWMRVVHNLSHPDNTITNTAANFALSIKAIDRMLPHANDILSYLKDNPNIDRFSSWQVTEEKIKAYLITKNDTWAQEVMLVEKHGYFNGQIGFILEFSGIYDYYSKHRNCDWDEELNKTFFDKFNSYCAKAMIAFADNYENRVNDTNYCLERAVLTKGDYLSETGNGDRYNLLSTSNVKNNIKRDHSWKHLLRVVNDGQEQRAMVKNVFDDGRFSTANIVGSLEKICEDGAPDCQWRDVLIRDHRLINYSAQGFMGFYKNDSIIILKELYTNMYHVELYTANMYLKHFCDNLYDHCDVPDFLPFNKIHYNAQKVNNVVPNIAMEDCVYDRKSYKMEISTIIDDNWEVEQYEIWFHKSAGKKVESEYSENIDGLMKKLGLEWADVDTDKNPLEHDDWGFFCYSNNEEETISKVKEICSALSALE